MVVSDKPVEFLNAKERRGERKGAQSFSQTAHEVYLRLSASCLLYYTHS